MISTIKIFVDKYLLELKVLGIVVVIGSVVWLWNDYRDMKNQLKQQEAINSTIASQFKQIGDAFQTQNSVFKSSADAQSKANDLFGKEVLDYMKANDGKIQSLYSAVGQVNSSVMNIGLILGGKRDTSGAVSGVVIPQVRPDNAPALTSVEVNYDPSKPLNTAFSSSRWLNNKEIFKPSLGEWQLGDGGYRAAFRLQREVYDDTGKKIGQEEIKLTDAQAQFAPSKFGADTFVPRLTLTPLATYNIDTKKWKPGALLDYRATKHFGVSGGYVNGGPALGFSWRFDLKK